MGNTVKTGKVFESAHVLDEDEERKCNLSRNFDRKQLNHLIYLQP